MKPPNTDTGSVRLNTLIAFFVPTLICLALIGAWAAFGAARPGLAAKGGGGKAPSGQMVVFGYNDLGMHCMGQDFSEICILPPYNTVHAQVIDRSGEDPVIVSNGVTVKYEIPGNTRSSTKTNFWTYAQALFGVPLPIDIGLAGNGLSGTMKPTGTNDWSAIGVPLTPIPDKGQENSYQLSTITVVRNGKTVARTEAVMPVSWELNCNLCHNTPGISVATDILRKHDQLHGTSLESQKPVLCASCHGDNALGLGGQQGVENLSYAMHHAHAPRMNQINLPNKCYACHPGVRTQCLRDVHFTNGMVCTDCHGDMNAVGNQNRNPWVDEPHCGDCHHVTGHQYEQPNTLYRNSIGHNGVHCEACHGSPHAITPTAQAADNVQAIRLQGYSGKINKCTVCHSRQPDDSFNHTAGGG